MIALLGMLLAQLAGQPGQIQTPNAGRWTSMQGTFCQGSTAGVCGTGAVAETIETKLRQTISVKDYGAVGDGVTDDSTAVNNAINASGTDQAIDFACPGNYKTTLYGTLSCGDYYPPIAGVTGSVPRSLPQKTLDIVDVKDFGAKGDGTTDDTAAIQAAITAVQGATLKGAILLIPSGTYKLCTGLPLVISGSIDVRGQGWNQGVNGPTTGTIFKICNPLSSATDEFLIQPTGSSTVTVRFSGFAVEPELGGNSPGRYVFHLDGTNGTIVDSIFERLFIALSAASSRAFYGEGNGLGQGTPAVSAIQDSVIQGGIQFTSAGDTVRILRNRIIFTYAAPAIDVSFYPGSSTLIVSENSIGCNVGAAIHIGTSAVAPQIINNEIETRVGFTGSNGSLVDLDGTAGSHITDAMVVGNTFQVVNGITTDTLRINYSDRAYVSGNRFGRGLTTSHDITVTANASDTTIPHNMWQGGGPYASMINNAGTRTMAFFVYPASNISTLSNAQLYGAIDEAGNPEYLMGIDSSGTANFYGYHSRALAAGANGISYFFDGTAGANVGLSISSAYSTVPVAGTFTTVSNLGVKTGVGNDQGGFKHKRVAVGCTTGAAIGAACTSAALAWTTAFADANYTIACTLTGPAGQPHISSVAQIAASFTVTIVADTAVGATGTVDCIAVHD